MDSKREDMGQSTKIKENMIGSNEIMPSPSTPRKFDSPRFSRQDSLVSTTTYPDIPTIRQTINFSPALSRHSPFVSRKLDDLMEVENEDTVRSVAELFKNNGELRHTNEGTHAKNQKNLHKMNGINNVAFIDDEIKKSVVRNFIYFQFVNNGLFSTQ